MQLINTHLTPLTSYRWYRSHRRYRNNMSYDNLQSFLQREAKAKHDSDQRANRQSPTPNQAVGTLYINEEHSYSAFIRGSEECARETNKTGHVLKWECCQCWKRVFRAKSKPPPKLKVLQEPTCIQCPHIRCVRCPQYKAYMGLSVPSCLLM